MGFWVFFTDDHVEYYDSDACELHLLPDQNIAIVANSKIILDFLIQNRNAAMSRSQILSKLDGGEESYVVPNKQEYRSPVDQAIRELRKKLDKYKTCVKTVRGVGYKYVGPPKVDKEVPGAAPSPPHASAAASGPKEAASAAGSPRGAAGDSEMGNRRVLAKLENALRQLVDAADTAQVNRARSRILSAVRDYADEIVLCYDQDAGEDENGAALDAAFSHHRLWLRRAIGYCRGEIEKLGPEDVLQDVKLQFLQDVYDFHLAIHLLSAQIYLAEQALELSGRLIQKEVRQSRIDSLYRDYRFAVEDAAMADLSLDEMLQEYGRGHVANKSSL